MLSTPGTYDLAQIEQTGGFSNVIPLKKVPGSLNDVMKVCLLLLLGRQDILGRMASTVSPLRGIPTSG